MKVFSLFYHYKIAAHCAAINGEAVLPESLGVSLGRHKLIGGDISPIEKDVSLQVSEIKQVASKSGLRNYTKVNSPTIYVRL